ncbi:hypothetical protein RhiirA1_515288 [Rhizophagus irregularis]|uniref:Uncharacterized protein n=1 Tax=Rhizophagus irregularis TaxID=588596 RepID=A0A2I1F0B5_9GLOM|nr:hypothetical protein RhiirA1_515288 [Rhizophagus irregularis]PKY27802.1 hypothetical protein RhiirB3_479303 [Rhizophagus irregularis]CAB4479539.1 unnamed protein product [Rhizophagus irregularis]CAB5364651.1 unnamed protein product [Rhizophagus irregularis]
MDQNLNFSSHIVNLPNSTIYKFEIPGFEIIVIPKSNQVMNLNNLNTQHQSYVNYSPVATQLVNQNQNYIINENFVSNSHINPVNNMNTDNLQYHQQLGYNNIQGGQPASNHFVCLPNSTTFDSSQPQVNHYKFEIPGFEIIVNTDNLQYYQQPEYNNFQG